MVKAAAAAAAAAAALLLGCAEGVRVKSHRLAACGQNGLSAKNMWGGGATECAWNWQVGILSPHGSLPMPKCSGVLIDSDWVLTAARCVSQPIFDVVVGEHNVFEKSGTEQIRSAVQVIRHPNYTSFYLGASMDFALVRLNESVDLKNDCVGTICLPDEGDDVVPGQNCWTTGWSTRGWGGSRFRGRLVQGQANIFSTEDCVTQYSDFWLGPPSDGPPYVDKSMDEPPNDAPPFDESMVCVNPKRTFPFFKKYACAANQGSPLVCQNNATGIWSIYGLMSWGDGCLDTEKGRPNVWARVQAAKNWIKETLDANPGPPPTRPMCPDFAERREPDWLGNCDCGKGQFCSRSEFWATDCPAADGIGWGGRFFVPTCEDCQCRSRPSTPPPGAMCPDFAKNQMPDRGDCRCPDGKTCTISGSARDCPSSLMTIEDTGEYFYATCEDCKCVDQSQVK